MYTNSIHERILNFNGADILKLESEIISVPIYLTVWVRDMKVNVSKWNSISRRRI